MTSIVEPVSGLTYYMDDRLKNNLDNKVKRLLLTEDEDYVLVIDGKERTGKSTLGMQIGKYVDPSLTLNRVCFTPTEFRNAILTAKKGQCVIFDEAYRGLGAAGALSEVNRILKSMMMEMGQKNLFVIVILPTFYLLEKYVALWRTRCLLHVYKCKRKKGYWKIFNEKKKQMLYLDPKGKRYYSYTHVKTYFKGRFYGKYALDEAAYRKKKEEAFRKGFKHTQSEKYQEQRDRLLYGLYKSNHLSLSELENFCKLNEVHLKKTQISLIIAKFKGRV